MAERASPERGSLFSRKTANEAAIFVAVVALLVDLLFYAVLADSQLSGGPLAVWSAIKTFSIAGCLSWLAFDRRAWSLGLIAAIYALIGLEDSVGVTAPLGIWLVEEAGIRRGPQGSNSQLLRRVFVSLGLLGPTMFLASRAPGQLRRAVWILIGFLGAIFVAGVLGDVAADRTGTNLDELLEEPVLSLAVGFAVGLVVEWWPSNRLITPTRAQHHR